ncbi:MAG: hypothetical protein A2X82_03840 [Geobacteraceae bacterium GWC2_55_20]|nr:MAG: hypothetical protein A2X82_03840 [Geobacteraceae bacterium GWC2_55_20]OGU26544.1 MAG: hypothetical protein A2X85_13690 [Geobacteraceae bacterium GWF2_54_21]
MFSEMRSLRFLKTQQEDYLDAILTDRFLRPLALLRLITRRPFLVAILTRKPWVRLRQILLGWKVLFIFVYLYSNIFQEMGY